MPLCDDCTQSASVGGTDGDGAEDGEWIIRDGAPWDERTASAINRSVGSGALLSSVLLGVPRHPGFVV